MGLSIGVLKETLPGERRVAITPKVIDVLTKVGAEVLVETGAGLDSGFPDEDYTAKGANIAPSATAIAEAAQILLTVRVPQPAGLVKKGQIVIGLADPLSDPRLVAQYAQAGATLFSLELVPRITRAQSMDVLSSMASIAGYKAVLIAASALPRLFPMMSTAAGTVPPARVLVIGAGVAGLQAIATARRLGAVVSGYDVRAAVKEQIESLGAKFVSITIGASGEGRGGYARALTDEEIHAAALSDPDARPIPVGSDEELAKLGLHRLVNVKKLRERLNLTQEEFAAAYRIPVGTLRDWEQRRKNPDAPARAYLMVIAKDPQAVAKWLRPAA